MFQNLNLNLLISTRVFTNTQIIILCERLNFIFEIFLKAKSSSLSRHWQNNLAPFTEWFVLECITSICISTQCEQNQPAIIWTEDLYNFCCV